MEKDWKKKSQRKGIREMADNRIFLKEAIWKDE